MPRYLKKSRFKLAVECLTKLFYSGKEKLYRNIKNEDSFLQALADGGFQFEDLTDADRSLIQIALPRYCELDTLAMVMIVEAWRGRA